MSLSVAYPQTYHLGTVARRYSRLGPLGLAVYSRLYSQVSYWWIIEMTVKL